MLSFARASSVIVRKPLVSRVISTFAYGKILCGAKWRYEIIEPIKGDGTHKSLVFKARVFGAADAPKWAVIKTAPPVGQPNHAHKPGEDPQWCLRSLRSEYLTYRLPEVAASPCFRKMYEVIGDPLNLNDDATGPIPCLALEWMDLSLTQLPPADAMRSYTLMKAVVDAVMSSCVVLANHQLINTDTRTVNILISDFDTGYPVVKVADLGSVYRDGICHEAQPYAMRAPEVYEGRGCVNRSQIWACAAMLLGWMKPGILGMFDNTFVVYGGPGLYAPIFDNSWCITRIRRLFPDWTPSPVEDEKIELDFWISDAWIKDPPVDLENIPSLEDQMQTMDMLPEMRGLFRLLFVVDPEKRPSAADVLASKEYLALAERARASLGKGG